MSFIQCSKLDQLLPGKVVYSGDKVYESEQGSYYSLIQADLEPACRVEPSSTEEVVTIVKLAGQEKCQFALRSGGHMTFKGAHLSPKSKHCCLTKFILRCIQHWSRRIYT